MRSEAQLSFLLESGFVYLSKHEAESGFGPCVENVTIPVTRESEGEMIHLSHVRAPLFATVDNVRAAFAQHGVVVRTALRCHCHVDCSLCFDQHSSYEYR